MVVTKNKTITIEARKVVGIGNSYGVVIPTYHFNLAKLKRGDYVQVKVRKLTKKEEKEHANNNNSIPR